MKNKYLNLTYLIAILCALSIVYLSTAANLHNPKEPSRQNIRSNASPPHENRTAKSCEFSKQAITFFDKYSNLVFNSENKSYLHKKSFLEDPQLKVIEKEVARNLGCPSETSAILVNIYNNLDIKEKANDYHNMILGLADRGDKLSIKNLCLGYDPLASYKNKLHYCQLITDTDDANIELYDQYYAYDFLLKNYTQSSSADQLITLCSKAKNDYTKSLCYYYSNVLLDFFTK